MALSDRIRAALANGSDLSQSGLAKACGISRASVNAWVNGKTDSIDGKYLTTAAYYLGVSAHWLSTGEGPMLPGSGETAPAIRAASLAPAPAPGAPVVTLAQALEVVAGALSSVPVEKRQALLGVLATYASDPVHESNSLSYLQSELAKTQARAGAPPSSIATGQPPGGKV